MKILCDLDFVLEKSSFARSFSQLFYGGAIVAIFEQARGNPVWLIYALDYILLII